MKKTLDDVLFDVEDYLTAAKRVDASVAKNEKSLLVTCKDAEYADRIEYDLSMKFGDFGPKVKRSAANSVTITPR